MEKQKVYTMPQLQKDQTEWLGTFGTVKNSILPRRAQIPGGRTYEVDFELLFISLAGCMVMI